MHVTIAGALVTRSFDADELGRVSIELAAFDGEIGTGAIPIDDPTAADDYKGGRQLRVDEIDTLLVNGFIGDQDRVRGSVPVIDRSVVYSVQDGNALLFAKRAVRSRPAETDVARVLAFAALDLSGVTTTWVLNANTANMVAKRYDGEGWSELISDTVDLTGKTLFIHDTSLGARCLHYHRLIDGHTCGLTITDVTGAADGVTSFAPGNPQKKTSPSDLGNNLRFVDQAGRVATYTDATSITDHDADGLAHQKIVRVEAGSQAHLDAIAAAQGAETKDERFTWTTTIGPLDATALSLIRVGDLITVTSQVMGLTATAKRIAHITLTLSRGDNGAAVPSLWDATLELGAPIRRGWPAKGKSLSKTDQNAATAVTALTPYCVLTYPRETFTRVEGSGLGTSEFGPPWNTTSTGNGLSVTGSQALLAGSPTQRASATVDLGLSGVIELLLQCTCIDADLDGSSEGAFWMGNGTIGGGGVQVFTVNVVQTGAPLAVGTTVTFALHAPGPSDVSFAVSKAIAIGTEIWIRVLVDGQTIKGAFASGSPPDGAVWDDERTMAGTPIDPGDLEITSAVDETFSVNLIAVLQGLPFACLSIGTFETPGHGQAIEDEDLGYGDGTTTSYTTEFDMEPGTLKVLVDGIDQTAAVIYSEGNEFHLAFPPLSSEHVTVSYQVA